MRTLIIVESPAKAATVSRHAKEVLGGAVTCRACLGHLRDLPSGRMGIDVSRGFAPEYEVTAPKTVKALRPLILQAEQIILATDPDREGEAVAWDILKIFDAEIQGKKLLRVRFQALTREAVQVAFSRPEPDHLNENLVKAAVARRVIDRLIGYHVSPRLWAALPGKYHGIGRVQVAALQLIAARAEQWEVHLAF